MTIKETRKIIDDFANQHTRQTDDDFFKDACIDEIKLTGLYNDLYGFEVLE